MKKRIGFACKFSENHPTKGIISVPKYNLKSTTISWLSRQTTSDAVQKLWDILIHNLNSISNLIEQVASMDDKLSMVRLGSEILPAYTHPQWKWFWKSPDVVKYIETNLGIAGHLARKLDIRLSMHPGHFCCLASSNQDIIQNSIDEIEYHTDIAKWMGYGTQFQDFKINVHISGASGCDGFVQSFNKLSAEARNCLTVENDEISYGLDSCLSIKHLVPIVLDIHHHLIKDFEYIQPSDDRIKQIIDSWKGVRPTFHYSCCKESLLLNEIKNNLPDIVNLLNNGYKKQQLQAHSTYLWNDECNKWALTHLDWADCMVEAKAKNLASGQLLNYD